MKTIDTLSTWRNYNHKYQIDKIEDDEKTIIIFKCVDKHPYGVLDIVEYKTLSTGYSSRWLNWDNIVRCSNYFEYSPEEEIFDDMTPISRGYLCEAVQKGLKPAATVRKDIENKRVKDLFSDLPSSCLILPYREEDTIFICQKGKIMDFFDLNEIRKTYLLHGVSEINWEYVTNKCMHEFSFFSDNVNSGINIERGVSSKEDLVIVGLLLGYPIESTVAEINKNHKSFITTYITEANKHFQESDNNYIDAAGYKWVRENGIVFIDEQREELYY